MDQQTKLLLLAVLVYLFNIPFGYWRANVNKYGFQWFVAIHLPVPPIIIVRILSDVGFHWTTYIYLVGGFFLGQLTGGKIYQWWISREREKNFFMFVHGFLLYLMSLILRTKQF